MTTGLRPSSALTGDVVSDLDRIRSFSADEVGFLPELRVGPRRRQEYEPD